MIQTAKSATILFLLMIAGWKNLTRENRNGNQLKKMFVKIVMNYKKYKIRKDKAFAIQGLVKGRTWNIIYDEQARAYISYDGFKLENDLYKLRGMFPNNLYEIVEVIVC